MITFFAFSFSFFKLFFHLICRLCFHSLDLFRCSPHWSVNMINDGDPLAICRSSPTFKLLKAFATFAAAAARLTWASWPKPLRQRRETVLSLAFCVFSRGVEREGKRKRETENGKTGRRSPQVAYLNVSRGFGDPCPHPPPCPVSCPDASPSFASLRLLRCHFLFFIVCTRLSAARLM